MPKNRKRRGRSEGSIFQRADGTWTASVSLGYDEQGKRRRRTVYGKTKGEVQDKLREEQDRTGSGLLAEAGSLTVQSYLGRWLQIVKPTVEPNTYGPYERHVRLHLVPNIGHLRLAKLAALHVEGLYATLAEKGMTAAMQRKVGTTLTIALGHAVRTRLLPHNPANDVRKPKAKKPDITPLDPDQVAVFLKAVEKDRLSVLYLMALDTGMGPGELFALQWADVDFTGGFVLVTKSLEEIDGKLRVKDVKTKKRRRRIDLSQRTLTALHEHRKRMLAEGNAGGPVFCDTLGGYLRIANVHHYSFKPALKRAGLPNIRFYDLRHTCATLLLLADESPKVVSERLGHASIQITLDVYSHVLPTMQKRAASTMNEILSRKPKKKANA